MIENSYGSNPSSSSQWAVVAQVTQVKVQESKDNFNTGCIYITFMYYMFNFVLPLVVQKENRLWPHHVNP